MNEFLKVQTANLGADGIRYFYIKPESIEYAVEGVGSIDNKRVYVKLKCFEKEQIFDIWAWRNAYKEYYNGIQSLC